MESKAQSISSKQYSREELWELYRHLPEQLQEAAFSIEKTDQIEAILQRYGVQGNTADEIIKKVSLVFFGILTPTQFSEELKKDLKLKKDAAEKISTEINRFIFYPLRYELEQLYKAKVTQEESQGEKQPISSSGRQPQPSPSREDEDIFPENIRETIEQEEKYRKKDPYRESVDENE